MKEFSALIFFKLRIAFCCVLGFKEMSINLKLPVRFVFFYWFLFTAIWENCIKLSLFHAWQTNASHNCASLHFFLLLKTHSLHNSHTDILSITYSHLTRPQLIESKQKTYFQNQTSISLACLHTCTCMWSTVLNLSAESYTYCIPR